MRANDNSPETASILAIVVLYHCRLAASQAVSSLIQLLNQNGNLATQFSVMLYDNSPEAQSCDIQARFPLEYIHDPSNGGLASAYNLALARAETNGRDWLLLFDQDTSATLEFLHELVELAAKLRSEAEAGAIVPKLLVGGQIYSPETHFLSQLRRQKFRSNQALTKDVAGLQERQLNAYNSGAALRVSALRSIGGFPSEFWLDYLDHAVFSRLFSLGFRIYVMHAELQHNSSLAEFQTIPIWRIENILLAQTLFVKQTGNLLDRVLYRIYLLRFSRNLRKSRKDSQVWKRAALQALLLRVPPDKPGETGPAARVS